MNKITVNNTTIEILINDIVATDSDAIVIPTNSKLLPSGTLRCKVLRGAGPKVQVECNKIIQQTSNIPLGKAVITSGGNLKTKYIIHTRAGHDKKKLMLSTWNALKLADQKQIRSVSFPPLSMDVIIFNAQICAEIILSTIKKYLSETNSNIRNIIIYLETLPDYKGFERVLEKISV